MRRAEAIAAASVTPTISSASSVSIDDPSHRPGAGRLVRWSVPVACPALVAEVPPPGEDHGQVVAVGDLDRHLVAARAAGLDDRA